MEPCGCARVTGSGFLVPQELRNLSIMMDDTNHRAVDDPPACSLHGRKAEGFPQRGRDHGRAIARRVSSKNTSWTTQKRTGRLRSRGQSGSASRRTAFDIESSANGSKLIRSMWRERVHLVPGPFFRYRSPALDQHSHSRNFPHGTLFHFPPAAVFAAISTRNFTIRSGPCFTIASRRL